MRQSNSRLIFWCRWIAVLPGAILAIIFANIVLHLTLYQTLTGSGFVKPYPELPERLLIPLTSAIGFIWGGAHIAPARRDDTAAVLFGFFTGLQSSLVVMILCGQTLMGERMYFRDYGANIVFSYGGALWALLAVRRAEKKGLAK